MTTRYINLTIQRAETREERRLRKMEERVDAFCTAAFVLLGAAVLVLVTVALCHATM